MTSTFEALRSVFRKVKKKVANDRRGDEIKRLETFQFLSILQEKLDKLQGKTPRTWKGGLKPDSNPGFRSTHNSLVGSEAASSAPNKSTVQPRSYELSYASNTTQDNQYEHNEDGTAMGSFDQICKRNGLLLEFGKHLDLQTQLF